jgi:hypothetical protein
MLFEQGAKNKEQGGGSNPNSFFSAEIIYIFNNRINSQKSSNYWNVNL